jgi:phosphoribosylformylglycinamidine cyclo-ligase
LRCASVPRNDSRSIPPQCVHRCVNDIVCCGAKPLFFLDYFATCTLDVDVAEAVVKGIFNGCSQCGAQLMGGETAEMPGMYQPAEYDLAGFAVGAVMQDSVVTGERITPGDVMVALPSSGLHSNGFSLVRKVRQRCDCAVSACWNT